MSLLIGSILATRKVCPVLSTYEAPAPRNVHWRDLGLYLYFSTCLQHHLPCSRLTVVLNVLVLVERSRTWRSTQERERGTLSPDYRGHLIGGGVKTVGFCRCSFLSFFLSVFVCFVLFYFPSITCFVIHVKGVTDCHNCLFFFFFLILCRVSS